MTINNPTKTKSDPFSMLNGGNWTPDGFRRHNSMAHVDSVIDGPDWQLDGSHNSRRRVLLVARESSTGTEAKELLRNLFDTVLRGAEKHLVKLPDFEAVLDQYDNPGPEARVFRKPGMRAVLISTEECDILLSLGSARKLDSKGDNAFVSVLVDVLRTGDYSHVISTTVSRLIRNTAMAGELEKALSESETTLVFGQYQLQVWDMLHKLQWGILVWFSNFEAEQIETRMIAGKLARARQGQWCFGFAPPPGWRRGKGGQLVVDEEAAEAVRWLVQQAASPKRLSWREIGRRFIQKFPDLPLRRGKGKVADAAEVGEVLKKSWLNPRWFPAYENQALTVSLLPGEADRRSSRTGPKASDARERMYSVDVDLPPHREPLATPGQLRRILKRFEDEAHNASGRAPRNSHFGSGMRWSVPGEVFDGVENPDGDARGDDEAGA